MTSTDVTTTVPANASLGQSSSLGLSSAWLNGTTTNYCYTYPQAWGQAYGTTLTYYPPRVRLTLSEIEKLRAAAKKDKALVAILGKFTGSIEVAVDFAP